MKKYSLKSKLPQYGDGTQEVKTFRLRGKNYDSQSLLKKYLHLNTDDPMEYSTWQAQPEQVWAQELEYSDHPEDIEARLRLQGSTDKEIQEAKAFAISNQKTAKTKKDTFVKSLKSKDYSTPTGADQDSTRVSKNYKLQKVELGLQKVEVPEGPEKNIGRKTALKTAGQGAAAGASVGAAFGPWGALIGGVVGGIGGGVVGALKGKKVKDEANREVAEATNLNYYIDTQNQYAASEEEEYTPLYATGAEAIKKTKLVEVEKDELVFNRDSRGRFKLAADFKGGDKHSQGGEDFVVQEGQVIFPGKMRKKVMEAYEKGDHLKLNSMRYKLPKDTNKAAQGLDYEENGWQQGANAAIDLAPSVYNILQGTKKPKRVLPVLADRSGISKIEGLRYNINPALQANEQAKAAAYQNARNLSGGNVSNMRNNQEAARIAALQNEQSLIGQKQNVENNYKLSAAELEQQANMQDVNSKVYAQDLNDRNVAAGQAATGAGLTGISDYNQVRQQKRYQMKRDKEKMKILNDLYGDY